MNQIIEIEKLEDAVTYLIKVANEYKIYGDLDNPEFEDIKKIPESIETVLQALENKDNEIQDLKAVNAMQEYRINEMDIPKKKIEDRIKELWKEKQELQDKYDKNIDKWIEEGKKAANEHKDRFTPYIPAREEIGIEQKIQNILGAIIELEKICNKF